MLRIKVPQEISGVLGDGIQIADQYLQVKINGDVALLKGIMKCLLEVEEAAPATAIDWDFVRSKTAGWEEFVADLKRESFPALTKQAGVSLEQMREAAQMIAASDRIIACWAM